VDRLVLWDPVVNGEAYLEEISTPAINVLKPASYRELEKAEGGEVYAVHGFPITPRMRRSIGSISTERFAPPLPPTLLVSTVDDPDRYAPLRRTLEEQGVEHTDLVMKGPIAWLEQGDFGTAGMPVQALRAIAGWLK
jgi:hypothetical protein